MGIFITLEGVEGAGKTTQLEHLKQHLRKTGYQAVFTREPGGTELGENIRGVLLDSPQEIEPAAELFLFISCRIQLLQQVILPALKAGKIVVCDRFSDATMAYQGSGRGISKELISKADHLATSGIKPDLTILLDIAPEEGLARLRSRKDTNRIDNEDLSFHNRVREGYLSISAKEKKRIKIINASQPEEDTRQEIAQLVSSFLEDNLYALNPKSTC